MIQKLKNFTVNMVAGANVAIIAGMLAAGFSDRLSPEKLQALAVIGMTFPLFMLLNLGFLLFWITFKWRKAWIPVLGFALAYVPISIYIPLNLAKDIPDDALKIVSYNVCGYGGNFKYEDGFATVYDYLAAQKADIVCIQEDNDSWRRYVMQRYEKIYPYNDTTVFNSQPTSLNGVGIHTRFPILRKERIDYETVANGSVAYYLQISGDTVIVINNHLESTHLSTEDRSRYKDMLRGEMERDTVKSESKLLISKLGQAAATRAPQADAIHRYVEEHSQYPIIVCGDFNDTPISYARRTVGKGLKDCFVESGRGIGLSYNQKGFFFRIDHLFCSSHFQPLKCVIDDKFDASDHNPLVCWLKIYDKP